MTPTHRPRVLDVFYNGHQFIVEYDHQPHESRTADYPGVKESIQPTRATHACERDCPNTQREDLIDDEDFAEACFEQFRLDRQQTM